MSQPYSITEVRPEWILESEALGSKEKFWFRRADDEPLWLYKHPQANTGQHWAEKVAAEVANLLGIFHAKVDLAVFDGEQGSASESFARDGRELYHGNQVLAGKVVGYDPARRFQQSDHTFENIWRALETTFLTAEGQVRAKSAMADYLVLDALIGNTDRHHENWGLMRKRVGDRWTGLMAPSFDHASSLGRELSDGGSGKSRSRILDEKRVGAYIERARGGIFWSTGDAHGLSPLELVRRASHQEAKAFVASLSKLERIEPGLFRSIIDRIPADWMTETARNFAFTFMSYTLDELRKVSAGISTL